MKGWIILVLGIVIGLSIVIGVKFLAEQNAYAQSYQISGGTFQIVDTKAATFLINSQTGRVYRFLPTFGKYGGWRRTFTEK